MENTETKPTEEMVNFCCQGVATSTDMIHFAYCVESCKQSYSIPKRILDQVVKIEVDKVLKDQKQQHKSEVNDLIKTLKMAKSLIKRYAGVAGSSLESVAEFELINRRIQKHEKL